MNHNVTEEIYNTYLAALLSGNRALCENIISRLLDHGMDILTLYTQLFQRSMYEVGEKWESGIISVATEHLATSVTESLMPLAYPLIFSREHVPRTAIVSCVADEYHQMGGRMVADAFEMNRWHGHFLGANTPLEDLQGMIVEKRPDVLALSVSIYFNMPNLERAIEVVKEAQPALPILIGGQAFRWGGRDLPDRHEGVLLLSSLTELTAWTEEFAPER